MRKFTDEQLELIRRGDGRAAIRKLNDRQKGAIRRLFILRDNGKYRGKFGFTLLTVAQMYGVSPQHISKVLHRKSGGDRNTTAN